MSETLLIPPTMRADIIDHARDHTPRECCGIIAGNQTGLTRLVRLTNVEPGNTRYLIDDAEFYQVYRDLDAAGEDVQVVYHSHPETVAYPSKTDVEFAFWPEAVYVICSLEHPDAPVLRAFRIVNGDITEVTLE